MSHMLEGCCCSDCPTCGPSASTLKVRTLQVGPCDKGYLHFEDEESPITASAIIKDGEHINQERWDPNHPPASVHQVRQSMHDDKAGWSMTDVLMSGEPPGFEGHRYLFLPGMMVPDRS